MGWLHVCMEILCALRIWKPGSSWPRLYVEVFTSSLPSNYIYIPKPVIYFSIQHTLSNICVLGFWDKVQSTYWFQFKDWNKREHYLHASTFSSDSFTNIYPQPEDEFHNFLHFGFDSSGLSQPSCQSGQEYSPSGRLCKWNYHTWMIITCW